MEPITVPRGGFVLVAKRSGGLVALESVEISEPLLRFVGSFPNDFVEERALVENF